MQLKRSCCSSGKWRTEKEPPGLLRTSPAAEGCQGQIQPKSCTWCVSLLTALDTLTVTSSGSRCKEPYKKGFCVSKTVTSGFQGWKAVPLWWWNRLWERHGYFIHRCGITVSKVSDVHQTPIHSTVPLCGHYRSQVLKNKRKRGTKTFNTGKRGKNKSIKASNIGKKNSKSKCKRPWKSHNSVYHVFCSSRLPALWLLHSTAKACNSSCTAQDLPGRFLQPQKKAVVSFCNFRQLCAAIWLHVAYFTPQLARQDMCSPFTAF